MPRRSLPERTVDAWVAATVCQAFSDALLWAPTQLAIEQNWDYSASLGDGKILIFEDKATSPVARAHKMPTQTHRIEIDRTQLAWYCDKVQLVAPVFYVLPKPPWLGPPTGSSVVPEQAISRFASPSGPFENWAFVVAATDLRTYLGNRPTIDTDELPFNGCATLAVFLNEVKECRRGQIVRRPPSDSTDRTGTTAAELNTLQPPVEPANEFLSRAEISRQSGSSMTVFIPSSNLPSFPHTSDDA